MSVVAHNIIKNTGFLYAKMGITVFTSLWTTRLILNSLGSSDFGLFNLIGGAIAMLGVLNTTMSSTTQRFMSYSEGEGDGEKKKRIFNISLVLHLFIALGTGLLLTIAGFFFFQGGLNIPQGRELAAQVVYASLVMSTIFTVAAVPYDAAITAHENMKYYAVVGIFEALLKLLVAFACTYTQQDKLIVYGVLMAIIPLITLVILLCYCHKHYEECVLAPRRYWDKQQAKSILSFASWNALGAITFLVGENSLGLLLNHFFGTVLNAAHSISSQFTGQLQAFSTNMQRALNPAIVKLEGGGERESMLRVSTTGIKISFYLFALFAIPAFLEMPYLLRMWLKSVPDWTILFTRLYIARSLVEQVTLSFSVSIAAEGRVKKINIITCMINLLPMLLTYIAFSNNAPPSFIYWAAIICFGILSGYVRVHFMNSNCGMSYTFFFRELLFPMLIVIIFSLIGGGVMVGVLLESWERLFSVIFVSTLCFFFAVWNIGLNKRERVFIVDIVKRRVFYLKLDKRR